jgi:hypothetical protein
MSQVATKRKLQLRDATVRVVSHFREQGSVLAGTKAGFCEDFTIELSVDSDEPHASVLSLIRQAHRMCFTEHALSSSPPIRTAHRLNGQPIELGTETAADATPGA